MKIALISEGTYPFAMGGVSVWCDQLLRGMPEHEVEFVALTVDGRDRPLWPLPPNVTLRTIPLWTQEPPVRSWTRAGLAAADDLAVELITPLPERPEAAEAQVQAFIEALRGIALEAQQQGGTAGLLTSDRAVRVLVEEWERLTGSALTLREALEWGTLLEHLLRPLAAPVVEADVAHASMTGPSMLVAMLAKWLRGTPVVLSEHGIYLRERYLLNELATAGPRVAFLRLNFLRLLTAASYRVADGIAPHSRYNRRWQLVNGAEPARMHTMYNGVTVDDFPVAEGEPDVPTVSFLGRIDPVKDVRTLISAFAEVHRALPHAQLRVFGGAPLGQEDYQAGCQALIEELGLAEVARLEGPTRHPVEAYHAGSVVALSSISEGFPFSVVEAMACGRPVVCTNVGGVSEAVGDGGLVVPPKDPHALGSALTSVLLDDERRLAMGRAARERVVEWFTVEQWVRAYTDLYDLVTSAPGPQVEAPVTVPVPADDLHRGVAAGVVPV
jgi:polysaccharide biosynthesis protein PelF